MAEPAFGDEVFVEVEIVADFFHFGFEVIAAEGDLLAEGHLGWE